MEIRHLAQPKLDSANLGQRIVGHRPCRECNPQMCVEQNGQGRVLAQNYGHGGSGWTLAPGAVEFVNDKLVEAICNFEGTDEGMEGKSKLPIKIVGAGVIGLFTAYDLLKRGFTNLMILAADFDELTSHNAGGLICPFALKIGDTVIKDWLEGMALNAYKYFAQIARGKNADFPAECAKIMPLYLDIGTTEGLDAYVKKGLMAPAKEVLVQFDGCQRQRKMMAFEDAIFVQTHQMMRILRRILESKGVQFVQRNVDSLDELEGKVVVNCTGMGAKGLCSDAKMHSAQGHLIMLKDQNPSDLNYMMVHWFENSKTASGHIVERCFYIFPKCSSQTDERAIGVLGGTFVQDANEDSPNLEEFDRLLANAKAFLSGQI